MAGRSGVSIKTTTYNAFKGADFSTDPSLVDKRRSPLCTNMVADAGQMPEKRLGWRVLHDFGDEAGAVNGLFAASFDGVTHFLAHVGTKLYRWDETDTAPAELCTGLTDGKSRGVSLAGALWIVTGGEYLKYDGTAATSAGADAYAPTTVITRNPDGTGGTVYESVNLISPRRKNAFQCDGTATLYKLDHAIDAEGDVVVTVWGEEKTETTDYTIDRTNGTVTFVTAPAAPSAGSADGVVIEFPATVEGYSDKINKCRIITTFGVGTSDRVVLSGNPDYPNQDWTSALNDPTYIPDLSYATVGVEGVAIMGYCRLGEYLGIVKEDNGQDTTIFLRSASLDESGNAVFTLKQAIAGVGAVCRGGFNTLVDEPLFLSGTGIYAISTNYLNGERVTQNRSSFLNAKLTHESALEEAEAARWMGLYLLAVGGGHVYVLDGRQEKTYRSESLGDFVYEGYYWEGVPSRIWLNWKDGAADSLYFGTADGRICKFNSDVADLSRFSDDGAAISCVWATKADDDGDATLQKTMIKRGAAVTLKPYHRSSAKVCMMTDRDTTEYSVVATDTLDIFDWSDIDFSRFSFESNEAAREIFFNTKVKKYKRLMILIKNDRLNEGFGVFGITKHFVYGNYAKR